MCHTHNCLDGSFRCAIVMVSASASKADNLGKLSQLSSEPGQSEG
jgi:hypothetical protein